MPFDADSVMWCKSPCTNSYAGNIESNVIYDGHKSRTNKRLCICFLAHDSNDIIWCRSNGKNISDTTSLTRYQFKTMLLTAYNAYGQNLWYVQYYCTYCCYTHKTKQKESLRRENTDNTVPTKTTKCVSNVRVIKLEILQFNSIIPSIAETISDDNYQ